MGILFTVAQVGYWKALPHFRRADSDLMGGGWWWYVLVWDCSDQLTFSSFSLPSSLVDLFSTVWMTAFLLLLLGGMGNHSRTRFICPSAKAILPSLQMQAGTAREESVILCIQLGKTRQQKSCQEWNNTAWDCIFMWAAPSLFPGLRSNQLELQS